MWEGRKNILFFINPDTGESIKPTGTIGYEDVYLTYDGNQKNIEFKIIRNDNGKEVQIIESIDITYTYKNPKTGNYEYGKPYMMDPGEYILSIKDCSYKKEYNLTYLDVALTIFIQEEGAAKDIELNVPYPINIKENESIKFSFTTPYSMCYKISAEDATFKVYDSVDYVLLQKRNEGTLFINKNQKLVLEIYSENKTIETNILITYSLELLEFGKAIEYELRREKDHIYKFVDERNHNLNIQAGNDAVGISIYDDKGHVLSSNDNNFSYSANQEIYVRIYNKSNQEIKGDLTISDYPNLLVNQKMNIELNGNETKTLLFDCLYTGLYEVISNASESVEIEICEKFGGIIWNNYLNENEVYFIHLRNKTANNLHLELILEYSPEEVFWEVNNGDYKNGFVRFVPTSNEVYLFSGVDEIYDYNFNPVKFEDNKALLDTTNKFYYLKPNNNYTVSIGLPNIPLKLGEKQNVPVNEYGINYYQLSVNYKASYLIETSAQSLYLYSNDFILINEILPNSTRNLLEGTYYLKVVNQGVNTEIVWSLVGELLSIGTKYALQYNGYTVFNFSPKNAQNYYFTSENDINNTAQCVLRICKLIDGEMITVYETKELSVFNESVYLENEQYYVFVYLYDANDQYIVFSVERNKK